MLVFALLILAGALAGNFLAVVIMRVPRNEDIFTKRSFCPTCGHLLSIRDIFPIIGWILLLGRCRYCKTSVSPRYLLLEGGCAVAALALGAVVRDPWLTAALFSTLCFGIFLVATRKMQGAPFLRREVFLAMLLILSLTSMLLLIPVLVEHLVVAMGAV